MKKIVPLICCLFAFTLIRAQDGEAMKKHYLNVYNQGLKYNDANTAIAGLHGYLAIDSAVSYKDTLSMLYFSTKNYYSALLLSEEVYKAAPGNAEAMARAAECYDQLGDPKTAVGLYEQVVPKTKNPFHVYKMAVGQYQLKRTMECELSARTAMADTTSKRIGVGFTNADGSQQAVPVYAAAANLLGVLQMDANNYTSAKTYFAEALKAFPQFAGAKQNMDACDTKMKGGTKPPAKPPVKPKG
ncbi:MAG: tetratricopeptide repeat protein [Chitinophagaceae bacterium]|nr:tetratricopeptide repeat protein [Chitinophagaceae bacterium]